MQVGCSLATGVRKSCVFQGKLVLLVVDLYLSPDVTNFPKLTVTVILSNQYVTEPQ